MGGLRELVARAAGRIPGAGVTFLRLARPSARIVERRDARYVEGSGERKHLLDVFAPEGARKAPVVHFVHGGYWVGGDKDHHAWLTSLYGSVGRTLAARGVVTVVQSYRLVPQVTFDLVVDDVMAGLRWTEEHAAEHGGDPQKLFMMGHSAGGHLTALAGADETLHTRRGMNPDAVRGYIPISAVWDVADMRATQGAAFHRRVTFPVFGRDGSADLGASPIARLSGTPRSFFVILADRDYPYLVPQAERARARLTELGAPPRYLVAKGDHDAMVLTFGTPDDVLTDAIVDYITAVSK